MGNNKYNMIGKKFNRLTVLEEMPIRKDRKKVYKCRCDCGNITYAVGTRLRHGNIKSCGCLVSEVSKRVNTKHGKRNTRLYNIWYEMKRKCYKPNRRDYKYYGARNIKVCDEWLNNFMNFYNWSIENGYQDNLTIDRIDVDGNYEPSNCRFVDMKMQSNNRRSNVLLTYNGKTQTMAQWAEELHLSYATIKHRHARGWSDKECLFGKRGEIIGSFEFIKSI